VPRVLLILPSTTYRAEAFLAAADDLGVEVALCADAELPLATGRSGPPALVADLGDPAALAAAAVDFDQRYPLDAVVGVDDASVQAAAGAAQALGLPHVDPEALATAADKAATRRCLARAEVPQPRFAVVPPEDPAALAEALDQVGLPCVVKPSRLSGSRGVLRAEDPAAAAAACARAAAIARFHGEPPDRPLVVESFVAGPEVAVEGLVDQGSLRVLAIFDKPDPLDGPAFQETIYVTPSRLARSVQTEVVRATQAAVAALGITQGPVHAELRVPEGRPVVLEVAARTIGGRCSTAVEVATGLNLEQLVLHAALGRSLPAAPRHRAAGVLMVPPVRAGRFVALRGIERARAEPGILGVEVTARPGQWVAPAPESEGYLAFVFSQGLVPAEAEAALRRAWADLEIEVVPGDPPGAHGRR
jgi:biotin carboxylase